MSYTRYSGKPRAPEMPAELLDVPARPIEEPVDPRQQPIRVDGFQQVLAMLRVADDDFRESLLARIAQRDRDLARSLRAELGI